MNGPFKADGCMVLDREGDLVAKVYRGRDARRIAADMNLADSIAAEPALVVTLALHHRDKGDTIRAATEFCAAVFPYELRNAIAVGNDAAKLLGLRGAAKVVEIAPYAMKAGA